MILLTILLKNQKDLDIFTQIFAELELFNTAVIEGNNIEGILERDIPLFAGLFSTINREKLLNYTIFAFIKDKDLLEKVYRLIEEYSIKVDNENILIFSFEGNNYTNDK